MGMIFVTHNMGLVKDISDFLAVMYAGQIVEYGKTKDILKIALTTGEFKVVKTKDIKKRDDAKLSGMPDFSHILKAQDVADISTYLMSTIALEAKK